MTWICGSLSHYHPFEYSHNQGVFPTTINFKSNCWPARVDWQVLTITTKQLSEEVDYVFYRSIQQQDLTSVQLFPYFWKQLCEAINITNKRSPVLFTYRVGEHPITWASKVKYLGIMIHSKLNWSEHCCRVVHKASLCLNRLRRAMFYCSSATKLLAYNALVRPCLEYGCTVWSPYTSKDVNLIESVQRRAARWIQNSRYDSDTHKWTKSSDVCVQELKLPTLTLRRSYYSLLMLHSIIHKMSPIDFDTHFELNQLSTRSHPLTLIPRTSTINAYRYSFFVNIAFMWNKIPYDILSIVSPIVFKSRLHQYLFSN